MGADVKLPFVIVVASRQFVLSLDRHVVVPVLHADRQQVRWRRSLGGGVRMPLALAVSFGPSLRRVSIPLRLLARAFPTAGPRNQGPEIPRVSG
jgi:hypothetical protein